MSYLPEFRSQEADSIHIRDSTSSVQPDNLWSVRVYAWIALFLASSTSTIVWVAGFGYKTVPFWDSSIRLAGLVVIFVLTWLLPTLSSIRGFIASLIALQVGSIVLSLFELLPPVASWLKTLLPYQFIFVDALLLVAFPTILMALTLIGGGLTRKDLFLTRGKMSARGNLLIRDLPTLSWAILGPILIAIFIGPLLAQLMVTIRPDLSMGQHILGALPFIVGFALLNAAQEEFRFRLVFLARLVPIIGARQALLMTSVLFGLGHWIGGHPSGLVGALIAGFGGWVLGASILETRGVGWAWLLHIVADGIVLTLLVMTTVLH